MFMYILGLVERRLDMGAVIVECTKKILTPYEKYLFNSTREYFHDA